MVKFLVTLLLAIIIFAPGCLLASKFFRLSDQASNSFVGLTEAIEDLSNSGKDGEERNFVLLLDQKTFVAKLDSTNSVLFNMMKSANDMENCLDTHTEEVQHYCKFSKSLSFSYIPQSCEGQCLIFCREAEVPSEAFYLHNFKLICQEMEVKNINIDEDILPFGLGRYYEDYPTRGYHIKFGSLERNERRVSLILTKKQGKINVREEGRPLDIPLEEVFETSTLELKFENEFNISLSNPEIKLTPTNISIQIVKIKDNNLFELNNHEETPHNIILTENDLLGVSQSTLTNYTNLSGDFMEFNIEVFPKTSGQHKIIGTLKAYILVGQDFGPGQMKVQRIPFSLDLNVLEKNE